MNRFSYKDFPAEKKTKFERRVKRVSLFDSRGNMINCHSTTSDKGMELTVIPTVDIGARTKGYVGYYENDQDECVVVFRPNEYFEVE